MNQRIQVIDSIYELIDDVLVCVGSIWNLYPEGNCLPYYDYVPDYVWNGSGFIHLV